MKAKALPKKTQKLQVKKPATLRDIVRLYGIKNGLLKEAQKLAQEDLCPST